MRSSLQQRRSATFFRLAEISRRSTSSASSPQRFGTSWATTGIHWRPISWESWLWGWVRFCLTCAGFRGRGSFHSRSMVGLWAVVMHASAAFALVLAWTLVPNGQEWYQDRFGVQGRMGGRWTFWSTGGRLVTLTLIFLMMSKEITGWGNTSPDIQFGLGYHADSFTMEAADFLDRHNEIKGNLLNTSMHQGDILIWKTGTKRKTYVDGRSHLFPLGLLEEWHQTRKALSDDDVAVWKPLLDKYEISAVMVEPADAPVTYGKLLQSDNWVPFYDDGRIVMFGRADAPATDLAFFKANKLDPASTCVPNESSDCRRGTAAEPHELDRRRLSKSDLEPAKFAHRIGSTLADGGSERPHLCRKQPATSAYRTLLAASWPFRRHARRLPTAPTTGSRSED